MTKQEAINELTRAAELCPTTPLAEACRMAVDVLSATTDDKSPHDCINCRHKDRTPGVYPCSQCEQRYSDLPTMWEPKEVNMGKLIDEQTAYDVLTDYYHHSTDTQHAALREALGRVETVDAVPVEDVFELAIALNKEIEALELSVRAYNALSRWACRTVGDVYRLLKSGKIKKVRNLGDKSIGEIEDRLCEYLPYLWRTEGR